MTVRLSQIDESNLADHARLRADDTCYHLYEYTSGRNFAFSQTNSRIVNLKKKPSSSSQAELAYKNGAIASCATELRDALNPAWLDIATLIPVPGSKDGTHPDFDDRMTRVCRGIRPGLDVRELVLQRASVATAHETTAGEERVSVQGLLDVYEIQENLALPTPTSIGIVDDVLTAGTHYRAMHTVLAARFPNVPIIGIFIARRVFPPDPA